MANASGKKISHWICLDGTKAYLVALLETTGIPALTLLHVSEGNAGTWTYPGISLPETTNIAAKPIV